MKIISIDPGYQGALAVFDLSMGLKALLSVQDMPTKWYTKDKAKKPKKMYDLDKLEAMLGAHKDECLRLYIESPLMIDTNSRYSTASTAFGAGVILGTARQMGFDVKFVDPKTVQAWLKKMPVIADYCSKCKAERSKVDSKHLSELCVKSLYPDVMPQLFGPRGGFLDGRADAIAIGVYGCELCFNDGIVQKLL